MNDRLRAHQLKFYNRYEYLAEIYARQINNHEKIALEKGDIIQELKLKIWTSIVEFIKKWKNYRSGGYKPVPMKFYIINVLKNKIKDWFGKIEKEMKDVPMSEINFDYGQAAFEDTHIDFSNRVVVVQGVDILQGMRPSQKSAMIMFLKGHKMTNIRKVHSKRGIFVEDVSKVVKNQVDFIRNTYPELNNKFNTRYLTFASVEN